MSATGATLRAAAIGAFRRLPPRWREGIKGGLGALGHEPGWAHALRARHLAETAKRLDHCARPTALLLHIAGVKTLDGCACMEFGVGHLLAEPLLYHLLGARRIVAVDYHPLLDHGMLGHVLQQADDAAILSGLSGLAPEPEIRQRLGGLRKRQDWSVAGLADLGISYLAPFDGAAPALPPGEFDLISSNSVLEHVPPDLAGAILAGLAGLLRPSGIMAHAIHLEDHRDMVAAPFAFLGADDDWHPEAADTRGNRLRASEWRALATAVTDCVLGASEPDIRHVELPPLAPRFAEFDLDDLRTRAIRIALRRLDPAGGVSMGQSGASGAT